MGVEGVTKILTFCGHHTWKPGSLMPLKWLLTRACFPPSIESLLDIYKASPNCSVEELRESRLKLFKPGAHNCALFARTCTCHIKDTRRHMPRHATRNFVAARTLMRAAAKFRVACLGIWRRVITYQGQSGGRAGKRAGQRNKK